MLDVSRSGYYAWVTRPISQREKHNQILPREIIRLHEKHPSLGLNDLYHILKRKHTCSRGRAHRLMKKAGIHPNRKAGFKVTTNSKHSLPIAPNPLGRNFRAATPNAVLVSDITYMRTGQGWARNDCILRSLRI